MEDSSKNIIIETIHTLCLVINELDKDKTKLSKPMRYFVDKLEEESASKLYGDNENQ